MTNLAIIEKLNELESKMNSFSIIQTGEVFIETQDLRKKNDKDKEDRYHTIKVLFNKEFEDVPNVIVGFNKLVSDTTDGMTRIKVRALNITKNGFDLEVNTWINCEVYEINVFWISHSSR